MTQWLVFLGFFIGGTFSRTAYEIMKKRNWISSQNKMAFAAAFLAMMAMWIGWFNLALCDPWRIAVPSSGSYLGLAISCAGYVLVIGGVIQLRGVENIKHLVTNGLYTKLRHPVYTGFICWIVGESIRNGAWLSFLAGVVAIANILYWRKLEETFLLTNRRTDYMAYRAKSWF